MIRQPCDIAAPRGPMISCSSTATVIRRHTGQHAVLSANKCRTEIIISRTVIDAAWKAPNKRDVIIGVRSIVANIVTTTLTLMRALTPVRMGVRAMASSCKPSRVVGWLCFNHPVVKCQVLTYAGLLLSLSPLLLPTFALSPCCVCM